MVYFALQHMGKKKKVKIRGGRLRFRRRSSAPPPTTASGDSLTVEEIRSSANSKQAIEVTDESEDDDDSMIFNIFDGGPDENSPWARFIDVEDYD